MHLAGWGATAKPSTPASPGCNGIPRTCRRGSRSDARSSKPANSNPRANSSRPSCARRPRTSRPPADSSKSTNVSATRRQMDPHLAQLMREHADLAPPPTPVPLATCAAARADPAQAMPPPVEPAPAAAESPRPGSSRTGGARIAASCRWSSRNPCWTRAFRIFSARAACGCAVYRGCAAYRLRAGSGGGECSSRFPRRRRFWFCRLPRFQWFWFPRRSKFQEVTEIEEVEEVDEIRGRSISRFPDFPISRPGGGRRCCAS